MTDVSLREIEEIVIAISSSEKRVIGFTSPKSDRVIDTIANGVSEYLSRSGRLVLLIDLQREVSESQGDLWTIADIFQRRNIAHKGQRLDIIEAEVNSESRYAFSDTGKLRAALEDLLDSYEFIILKLGPVIAPTTATTLNPLPVGAACDHVLLTCRRGIKRPDLRNLVHKLRAARCVIGGIILNEIGYSSPGHAIGRSAYWILWPAPRLRKRFQNWATSTDLLN